MQLRQHKNMVKVTQVFLQCMDRHILQVRISYEEKNIRSRFNWITFFLTSGCLALPLGGRPRKAPKHTGDRSKRGRWLQTVRKNSSEYFFGQLSILPSKRLVPASLVCEGWACEVGKQSKDRNQCCLHNGQKGHKYKTQLLLFDLWKLSFSKSLTQKWDLCIHGAI